MSGIFQYRRLDSFQGQAMEVPKDMTGGTPTVAADSDEEVTEPTNLQDMEFRRCKLETGRAGLVKTTGQSRWGCLASRGRADADGRENSKAER